MAGMHIVQGHFDKVSLDGLSWAVTYRWPGALHEGNGTVQAFIDHRANSDQRAALLRILSGRAGNAWFEFLASTVTQLLEPQFVPIAFEFDKGKRTARVAIAGALETVSAPLIIPNIGQEQHVTVRMPNGIEYREFEVAQAMMLRGTAALKFDHHGTHSSLAEVEHTHLGIRS
jgi:hypothetical protein